MPNFVGAVRRKEELVEGIQGEGQTAGPSASITEFCGTGSHFRWVTVGALPDEVLLEIFSFYINELERGDQYEVDRDHRWRTLIHVCRRWRTVVFASPCRLDLRLLCTEKSPVREMLDIWPALPISICSVKDDSSLIKGADNITAALEHNDRVCQISLRHRSGSHLEEIASTMHEPFPALTHLHIVVSNSMRGAESVILFDEFLGGSASHLRHLSLSGIAFPALPNLLLSATDLVDLHLNIPHMGHISPEAMATCLSVLTRLETLAIQFCSIPSTINRPPFLPTRTAIPALTDLHLQGPSEYLDDLICRIDVPVLAHIDVVFCDQHIFRTTQLVQFLSRTEKLSVFNRANLTVSPPFADIMFFPTKSAI